MIRSVSALSRTLGAAAAIAAVAVAGIASPQASTGKTGYDGTWSVLIVTENGECDRAYRYSLRIDNGNVKYQGDPGTISIDIAGKVDDSGRLKVSVSKGEQRADGVGRIAKDRGAGTWKGKSSTAECSGRWEAERRGV
jgi:hypothetical protein